MPINIKMVLNKNHHLSILLLHCRGWNKSPEFKVNFAHRLSSRPVFHYTVKVVFKNKIEKIKLETKTQQTEHKERKLKHRKI